jgi:hypothetical protein
MVTGGFRRMAAKPKRSRTREDAAFRAVSEQLVAYRDAVLKPT